MLSDETEGNLVKKKSSIKKIRINDILEMKDESDKLSYCSGTSLSSDGNKKYRNSSSTLQVQNENSITSSRRMNSTRIRRSFPVQRLNEVSKKI